MREHLHIGSAASAMGDDQDLAGRGLPEPTKRIDVLAQLDAALAKAARRYDLAPEMGGHGWPRSPRVERAD